MAEPHERKSNSLNMEGRKAKFVNIETGEFETIDQFSKRIMEQFFASIKGVEKIRIAPNESINTEIFEEAEVIEYLPHE